jgi:hypothetical protein
MRIHHHKISFLGFILFFFCLTLPMLSFSMDIIKDSVPQITIIIPEQSIPVVTYAAEELQYHIGRACGSEPEIIPENQASSAENNLVFLGDCEALQRLSIDTSQLANNGFAIVSKDNRLFIAGDDNDRPVFKKGNGFWSVQNGTRLGTLFGVYHLLENYFNARWLFPGPLGEDLPLIKNLSLPDMTLLHQPRLRYSQLQDRWFCSLPDGWADTKQRERFTRAQSIWLRRHRFAVSVGIYGGHSFSNYWDRFHDSHPEYFNLLPNGKRDLDMTTVGVIPENPNYSLITMCVSNPGLAKQVVQDWVNAGGPDSHWLSCGENDALGRCTCENCLAWDAAPRGNKEMIERFDPLVDRLVQLSAPAELVSLERATEEFNQDNPAWPLCLGPLTDRYAKFFLAVQKEARKHDPEVKVATLAYANVWPGPVETELNEDIWIQVVPTMLYPWSKFNRWTNFYQWEGWHDSGASLILRPNYTLAGHNMPQFIAKRLGEHFKYCYERGMQASDFCALKGQWATQGINLYVLSRLHNSPEKDINDILEEYYEGFGTARRAIKRYFRHLEKADRAITDEKFYAAAEERNKEYMSMAPRWATWVFYHRVADLLYDEEFFSEAFDLLDRATRRAGENATVLARIDYLRKGLKNAQLTCRVTPAFIRYKEEGVEEPYRKALEELRAYRGKIEPDLTGNMAMLHWAEVNTWDRSVLE